MWHLPDQLAFVLQLIRYESGKTALTCEQSREALSRPLSTDTHNSPFTETSVCVRALNRTHIKYFNKIEMEKREKIIYYAADEASHTLTPPQLTLFSNHPLTH